MRILNILNLLGTAYAITEQVSQELLDLHKNLILNPSITRNETLAVDFLSTYLQSKGWNVELQDVINKDINPDIKRQNIFAYLNDPQDVKMILNSHTDVVPPYVDYHYTTDEQGRDVIYGRGANDAKGQIAAQITAAQQVRSADPEMSKSIGLLYDLGEEGIFDGAKHAQDNLPPNLEYFIVGEPTQLEMISGHKGE